MCPDRRKNRGFAAMMALVLLALLAVLASALVFLSSTQQMGFALDIQGGRAYQAARAGLEWGVHHVLRVGGTDCAGIESGGAGTTFAYAGDLAGYFVTVRCGETTHDEAGATLSMYQVAATGCNQLAAGICDPAASPTLPTYVERQLRVVVGSN